VLAPCCCLRHVPLRQLLRSVRRWRTAAVAAAALLLLLLLLLLL
jgi:hypothetical protein